MSLLSDVPRHLFRLGHLVILELRRGFVGHVDRLPAQRLELALEPCVITMGKERRGGIVIARSQDGDPLGKVKRGEGTDVRNDCSLSTKVFGDVQRERRHVLELGDPVIVGASAASDGSKTRRARNTPKPVPGGIFDLALRILGELPFLRGGDVVHAREVDVLSVDPAADSRDNVSTRTAQMSRERRWVRTP